MAALWHIVAEFGNVSQGATIAGGASHAEGDPPQGALGSLPEKILLLGGEAGERRQTMTLRERSPRMTTINDIDLWKPLCL